MIRMINVMFLMIIISAENIEIKDRFNLKNIPHFNYPAEFSIENDPQ